MMSSFQMSRHQCGTLAAAGLGFVVVLLDVSVVNVALDTLRSRFATDMAGLQWIVNAYTLAFASLLLTAGALGDRFGAKQLFISGFAVFTVASLACGLATSLVPLVTARIVQGVGAALLVPNSLAMLQKAFPDSEQRNRAVGWWSASGGVALAGGPVLGGLLIAHMGWRSIFLINLPIGIAGLAIAARYTVTARSKGRRGVDLLGQLIAILALATLTAALTEASRLGWCHPWVLGAFLLSAVAVSGFLWLEARSLAPMLPLSLFRSASFSIASAIGVIINFAYYGLIFVFSLFFQAQQYMSAQQTGLAFLPMTIVLMFVNLLASRLITRLGSKRLMVRGLTLAAVGYSFLLPVNVHEAYWLLAIPMLMAASGIAVLVPTITNVTLSAVDASRSGIASGVLNAARQIGGLLGVAVFGFFVRDTTAIAFLHGLRLSIATAVTLLLLGCVLCLYGIKVPKLAIEPKTSPFGRSE